MPTKEKKMRGVIYSRTVIVENNPRLYYQAMSYAIEHVEEAGQMYGYSEAVVSEDDSMPEFLELPLEYQPI